jgi:hypothetical protein
MDALDLFFKKYSYKFDKGYPDMNNNQDVLLLESILLNELGIDLNEGFNPLKFYDLQKYGGPRLKKVADKIKKGEPFDTVTDEQVVLLFNKPEYEPLFTNADIEGLKTLAKSNINAFPFFADKNGKEYSIKDLLKSKDFGGKGGGSGTRVEDIALEDVSKKIQELGSIDVKLSKDGEVYKGIIGATTVNGTPKADFTFNTDSVSSVNGQTGAVSLTASDVGAAPTTRTITAGTGVVLQIASGQVLVPSLIGTDALQAKTLLVQAGFLVNEVFGYDADQPIGVVIRQAPDAGTTQTIGKSVTITVNKAP